MLINFNELEERDVQGMHTGTGTLSAKMYMSEMEKSYH